MLTIVMYHYVRDLTRSAFPGIKGLLPENFEGQLDYIERCYTPCGARDIVAACRGEIVLPENACHLTFDDGFVDHHSVVLPRLVERGLSATFFVPAAPLMERRVLDVHKLHFLLAAVGPAELLAEVADLLGTDLRDRPRRLSGGRPVNRFDPPEVADLKWLLQRGLPVRTRGEILDRLFCQHITTDEEGFVEDLYMGTSQIRELLEEGMTIGGHGTRHDWLKDLSAAEQKAEIDSTLSFLQPFDSAARGEWVMSYPYGSYDSVTLGLLKKAGCGLAMTTRPAVVRSLERYLELPRLDTNDLPHSAASAPCEAAAQRRLSASA